MIRKTDMIQKQVSRMIRQGIVNFGRKSLEVAHSRSLFYSPLKCEEYLNIEIFYNRRVIVKVRSSDHHLEVEWERHSDTRFFIYKKPFYKKLDSTRPKN